MKYRKILIATILLLAIMTFGAVSASEDADAIAQGSDVVVSEDNAIDNDLSSAADEDNLEVERYEYRNSRIEYYNGTVDENYDGPIVVAYVPKQNAFTLFLSDMDSDYYTYFYLSDLQEYENGLSSNNSNSEWGYYGITAGDVDYFDDCPDGATLTMYLTDIMQEYAPTADSIGSIDVPIYHNANGFSFIDSGDEPVGPTVILEIYGTEYMKIDYNNGMVFTIIVSGNNKSGEWKPVDILNSASLGVYSGDIDFLDINLNSLDYTAAGDEVIEHIFTLDDLDNFEGLSDGSSVVFLVVGNGVQYAFEERTIYFEEDGIRLDNIGGDDDDEIIFNDDINIANNDIVVSINKEYLPSLGEGLVVNITVNVWGHFRTTTLNLDEYEPEDIGYYQFKASDLGLDMIMRDISINAECEVTVIYNAGSEDKEFTDRANVYINPYIVSGDVTLNDQNSPAIVFTDFEYFMRSGYLSNFTINFERNGTDVWNHKSFDMNDMDQYWEGDEEESSYNLYLEDLGITENGFYNVNIQVCYINEEEEFINDYYYGDFEVVDFLIDVPYGEDKAEYLVDEVSLSVFRIILPDDTTNRARVYVNGTKVLDKSLAEIGTVINPMGRESFPIYLNDLQITESGKYNVKLEVLDKNNHILRSVSTDIWVEVSENSIGFRDILYFSRDYVVSFLGAPISDPSDMVLFLNGQRAGVGTFIDMYGFTFELDDDFIDAYGNILPGDYDAVVVLTSADGNQTLASGSFSVLNDSGTVEMNVFEDDSSLYLQIKGSQPDDIGGYILLIVVDPHVEYDDENPDEEIIYEDWELEELLDNEVHTIYLGGYEPGDHLVWVEYRGGEDQTTLDEQDYFLKIFNVTIEDIQPIDTVLTAPDVSVVYNTPGSIVATLSDVNGIPMGGVNVKITVGSLAKTLKTNADGQVALDISSLAPGIYTADIKAAAVEGYNKADPITAKVTVKSPTTLTAHNVTSVYNSGEEVVVAVLSDAFGNPVNGVNVKVTVGNIAKTVKTNANGQALLDISTLTPGNYTASIKSATTELYNKADPITADYVVSKGEMLLDVPDAVATYNTTGSVVATLSDVHGNAISGVNVKITVGSLAKTLKTDADGKVALDISSLNPGSYTATVKSATTDVYERATATAGVVVNKMDTILTVPDVTALYNTPGSIEATFKDINGNVISGVNVKITVGSLAKTLKTDANGKVSLDVNGFDVGTYSVAVKTATTDIYNRATASATFTVLSKLPTVLDVPDVIALANHSGSVVATLSDINGNPVSGVNVKITVGSLAKTLKTDANGKVSLNISGLDIGTYAVAVKSATTDIYERATASATAEVVSRLPTILTVPNAVAVSGISGSVVAFLKDINGNPVSGVNVKITVGSLAKTLKTDANGKVALDISSLAPGTYAVSVKSAIADIYERATATSTAIVSAEKVDTVLTVPDISIAQNSGEKITATFKDVYGNVISGVNVKITVGSIAKTLKTDENGQVSLDVSSLAPGTYTATIKTAITDVYNRATATSKVTIS